MLQVDTTNRPLEQHKIRPCLRSRLLLPDRGCGGNGDPNYAAAIYYKSATSITTDAQSLGCTHY